jgi:hypothetical protein
MHHWKFTLNASEHCEYTLKCSEASKSYAKTKCKDKNGNTDGKTIEKLQIFKT